MTELYKHLVHHLFSSHQALRVIQFNVFILLELINVNIWRFGGNVGKTKLLKKQGHLILEVPNSTLIWALMIWCASFQNKINTYTILIKCLLYYAFLYKSTFFEWNLLHWFNCFFLNSMRTIKYSIAISCVKHIVSLLNYICPSSFLLIHHSFIGGS